MVLKPVQSLTTSSLQHGRSFSASILAQDPTVSTGIADWTNVQRVF